MILQHERLAFRYASAFLNVFISRMSLDDAVVVYSVYKVCKKNRQYIFFLDLPTVSVEAKNQLVQLFFSDTHILEPMQRLLTLLLEQKRAVLFDVCLNYIWRLYQQRNKILFFNISSAPELTTQELNDVELFLKRLSGNDIVYEYARDERLIAGIRLQADEYMWEYSIAQQLQIIHKSLV